jgi:hypothetical protein
VPDGTYTIMQPQNVTGETGSGYWSNLTYDHTQELTGATDGALMVLNAGGNTDLFYRRDFNVQPGYSYRISVWRYTVNNNLGNGDPIAWSLRVQEVNSGTPIVDSGPIQNTARYTWEESVFEFSVPASCTPPAGGLQAQMSLRNESPVTGGNDIYIDDISVTQLPFDGTLPTACPTERSDVVATDDGASTPPDTPVTLNVTSNDTTASGNLGQPRIVTPPADGSVTVNPDGTVTYTPPAGFTGQTTFEYEVCNDATPQACDTAQVTIRVAAATPTAVPTLGVGAMALLGSLLAGLGFMRRRRPGH